MDNKNVIPTKLFWVDLEMTGLDATKDVILEVAAEITDFNFRTLASYESRIKHPRDLIAERMQKNNWWQQYPHNRDEFLKKCDEGKTIKQVEAELVTLLEEQFESEPVVLAGNSIHSDRAFIKAYWPILDLKLHYRMLDVSSFKILMQGKYGHVFDKDSNHRAFDDIQASIAELQDYINWFGTVENNGS
jgi:oligoribonuclease